MRPRRFKADDLTGERVTLAGKEARHALRVLRLKVDDPVRLFDGLGNEADGRIESIHGGQLVVRLAARGSSVDQAPCPTLTLAVSTPKGPRADWLVEKCAELGVTFLQPLICGRSEVIPQAGKLQRWRRLCDQAARQSGRTRVMEIAAPCPLADYLRGVKKDTRLWFGDLDAAAVPWDRALRNQFDRRRGAEATMFEASTQIVLIGPEGGWTDEERAALLASGAQPVRLAPAILRVETAAVAAAAIWAAAEIH